MSQENYQEQSPRRRAAGAAGFNFIAVLNRLLAWVLVGMAVAAVLEFYGPYQGWFERRFGGAPAPAPAVAPEPVAAPSQAPLPFSELREIPTRVEDFAKIVNGQAVEPEKSPLEKRFDELYNTYLAKMRPPVLGKEYNIKLRDGTVVPGILEEAFPGRITLGIKFGKMVFTVDRIHPHMYPVLFPEMTARLLAGRALRQSQAEEAAAEAARREAETAADLERRRAAAAIAAGKTAPPPPASAKPSSATATTARPPAAMPTEAGATVASSGGEKFVANPYGVETDGKTPPPIKVTYNPAFAPTPASCRQAIQSFGQWLNVQHRKIGGKIAETIYAKQHGRAVVLYVVSSADYREQSYDTRYGLLQSLWGFWGMRAQLCGNVSDVRNAHLVLLDNNNRIIGGSSAHDGSELWVDKKGLGPMAQK